MISLFVIHLIIIIYSPTVDWLFLLRVIQVNLGSTATRRISIPSARHVTTSSSWQRLFTVEWSWAGACQSITVTWAATVTSLVTWITNVQVNLWIAFSFHVGWPSPFNASWGGVICEGRYWVDPVFESLFVDPVEASSCAIDLLLISFIIGCWLNARQPIINDLDTSAFLLIYFVSFLRVNEFFLTQFSTQINPSWHIRLDGIFRCEIHWMLSHSIDLIWKFRK